jgi:malic enzyme
LPYKRTNLYFRGHNSTIAKLNSLEKNNKLFSEVTHVVVGGGSAGGLAAFLWADFIKERVKNGKVWALPDSGIFLNRMNVNSGKYTYKNIFKNLMSISNVEIAPPVPLCV